MMFKYYNSNLVKNYRSYSIEQICELYKEKKLHPQTIREWIKNSKLKSISKNPILIYGTDLKSFLNTRNCSNKRILNFNQFKCVKCKEIYVPMNNEIYLYRNKNKSIKGNGKCPICFCQNYRFYKEIDEQKLYEVFIIQEDDVSILCNTEYSICNTYKISEEIEALKELCKKEEIL